MTFAALQYQSLLHLVWVTAIHVIGKKIGWELQIFQSPLRLVISHWHECTSHRAQQEWGINAAGLCLLGFFLGFFFFHLTSHSAETWVERNLNKASKQIDWRYEGSSVIAQHFYLTFLFPSHLHFFICPINVNFQMCSHSIRNDNFGISVLSYFSLLHYFSMT